MSPRLILNFNSLPPADVLGPRHNGLNTLKYDPKETLPAFSYLVIVQNKGKENGRV